MQVSPSLLHETMVDNDRFGTRFGKLESKVQETELTVISNRELIKTLQTEKQELNTRCAKQDLELTDFKALLRQNEALLRQNEKQLL